MPPPDGSAGSVTGLDDVLENLNKAIAKIKGDVIAGLLEAGLLIERESDKDLPVEFGNLKGSSYTRRHPTDPDAVQVGYTAAYAVFVHEATEEKLRGEPRPSGLGTYWNPGKSKFLENTIEENRLKILMVIAKRAEIRG